MTQFFGQFRAPRRAVGCDHTPDAQEIHDYGLDVNDKVEGVTQWGGRLIGRRDELGRLKSFLAGEEAQHALLLVGDAGIGKSMLAQTLSAEASAQDWRVLHCGGVEAESTFVLAGLGQLVYPLRKLVDGLDASDQHMLQAVLGALPDDTPSVSALTFAVLRLLSAAGSTGSLLVVLDDAHWFDELSAQVLAMVGRRLDIPTLRVIALCRNEFPSTLLTGGWPQLVLSPLDSEQSELFLDEMGVELAPKTRAKVLEQAAGNPLALAELSRFAVSSGWSLDTNIPLTKKLIAIFGERLKHLDPPCRSELLSAALDGVPAGSVGWTPTRTRYAMKNVEAAQRCGIVVMDDRGEAVFRHPLVRAAVIQESTSGQRRSVHGRLADLYPDDVVRRAAHLAEATIDPDQAVADTLAEAANRTVRRGGAGQAVDLLRRAAALCEQPHRRGQLLADAAFVASQAARLEEAGQLVDQVGPGGPAADALLLTSSYVTFFRDGDVAPTFKRLVRRLRSPDDLDAETFTRMVNLLLSLGLYAQDPDYWAIVDDVVDASVGRLSEVNVTLIYRDALADAARRGASVRQRFAVQLDRLTELEPWDVMRLAVAAHFVDMVDEVRPALAGTLERELDSGATANALGALGPLVLEQIDRGQWTDALETAQRGLALSSEQQLDLFSYNFKIEMGIVAAGRGDLDTARDLAAEVQAWARPRRLGFLLGYAEQIALLCALAEGDYASAYHHATLITAAGEFPPYSHHTTRTVLDFVEAAVYADRIDQARQHVNAAKDLGWLGTSPRLAITIGGAMAMSAPDETGPDLFDEVLRHPAFESFPFEAARIRLAYGMRLRRLRRHDAARTVLSLAAETFAALGAKPWEQRAHNEIRATRATAHRPRWDSSVQLSSQERRVAELAAEGHSNKDIGAQLHLSPRTVSAHLYRLFPKLGVTSRGRLRAALDALDAAANQAQSS